MQEFSGSKVTIMSCSDCNANCRHCYVSYHGNIEENELNNICFFLKDKYTININGTEILLHKGYLNAIALINQYRILTNGIIINNNPKILKEIKKSGVNMIAMSYHFGIHENISTVDESIVKENISLIQKEKINVELMCTITQKNYNKIDDICRKVLAMGVHKVRFINYLTTGSATKMEKGNALTEEQKKIFFRQLSNVRKIYSKEQLLIKRCGTFGKDQENKHSNFMCSAGYNEVVIAPDMKIYPCIFLVKPGFDIGKYENGKVMINKTAGHSKNICLANEIYNNGMLFDEVYGGRD